MTAPAPFEWLYELPLSTHVRESLNLYSALDVAHVLGVLLLVGSIVVVDLRLLGKVFAEVPIPRLSAQVLPLTWLGALIALGSGALLFAAQATKIWNNPVLLTKFALLLLAAINVVAWHRDLTRHQHRWSTQAVPPLRAKLAGGISLALWATILVSGRLIAFVF